MNDTSMNYDFNPSDLTSRIFHWWWLILVFMVIGAISGILFARLQKPVYESTSSITTSIDFAYAGRLTDYEEDQLINAVGDIILSTPVLTTVQEKARSEGVSIDEENLQRFLSAARQGYRWELSTRSDSPQTAQMLNQFWMDAAREALSAMRQNSIDAIAYLSRQLSVEDCFSQLVLQDPVSSYCEFENWPNMDIQMPSAGENSLTLSLLDNIFMSRISFQITEDPTLPVSPVLFNQNISALLGGFLGLLIVLAAMISGYPKKKSAP